MHSLHVENAQQALDCLGAIPANCLAGIRILASGCPKMTKREILYAMEGVDLRHFSATFRFELMREVFWKMHTAGWLVDAGWDGEQLYSIAPDKR